MEDTPPTTEPLPTESLTRPLSTPPATEPLPTESLTRPLSTPPATEPLPTEPLTRPLPAPPATEPLTRPLPQEPTEPTLPDPSDLRPPGPARRWTWMLSGMAAGAGCAALALGLTAALTSPAAPSVATRTAAPSASASASPTAAAQYTTLVSGCSLLRPATVARYASGAKCLKSATFQRTSSGATWQSAGAGYVSLTINVELTSVGDTVYRNIQSTDRLTLLGGSGKILDERSVTGLGDEAHLMYGQAYDEGRAVLTIVQRNALVEIQYSGAGITGFSMRPVTQPTAEAAVTACAHDILATLTAP